LKSDIGAEVFKDSVYPQADAVGWAAVAAAGGAGLVAGGEGFGDLFRQMVSYEKDAQSPGHSNALGALFKTLVNPGEENV
jgi:hypothetical protein